jgi:hypothetical protein
MIYLIILVVHDVERFEDVMNAWHTAGVSGVTILPSIGMKRINDERALREDLPLMPMLSSLFEREEELNRTLFTLVEGDELKEKVITATAATLGDLDLPNTGVMAILPVVQAFGLHRRDE